ncbi:MAG: CoA transferase [Myxococcota bacterium]|jgi:CoA:oxalate CoA-transferase
MKPLEGLKVLDFSHVLAGPCCTMILADYGADVIKVEPAAGDPSRQYGPHQKGESIYFASINRGKRSIVLDLKSEEGKNAARILAMGCDVLVENFRPGVMERLGLGFDDLRGSNPGLIYACASGFGRTGPLSGKPAYDIQVQAMCGMMNMNGAEGGEPLKAGPSVIDIVTGMTLANGIMAALYARHKTGQGQMVDVAMLDVGVALMENAVARYFATGKCPASTGNRHASITPFDSFTAGDGKTFVLAIAGERMWRTFCVAVERNDLATDPRFADNPQRTAHHAELKAILEGEVFSSKGAAGWVRELDLAGVPCTLIAPIDTVVCNPQLKERGMLVKLEHPVAGAYTVAGVPVRFTGTPASVDRPAPALGQHTKEILGAIDNIERRDGAWNG